MFVSVEPLSRTVYVTTRKVASQTLEHVSEFDQAVWLSNRNIHLWQDHRFVVVTRDPTDRFISMYNFLMNIYDHKGAEGWEDDHIYRSALSAQRYTRFFRNLRWRSTCCLVEFAQSALPQLSRTVDLHWRTQCSRLRLTGVDRMQYIRVPLQHLNSWLKTQHGISVVKTNSVSLQLEDPHQVLHRQLDPILRASVWKEDYALHEG